jgi:hypothetical protein
MRTKAAEPFSARSLAASASDRLLLRAAARPCASARIARGDRRPDQPGGAWVDLRLFSEQFGDLAWHGGAIEELHGRRAVRLHPIPPPDQHGWRFCRRRRNLWARPFRLGRPRHNLTCRRHLPRRAAFFFSARPATPWAGPMWRGQVEHPAAVVYDDAGRARQFCSRFSASATTSAALAGIHGI